jgi:hypothetical protein
MKLVEFPIVPQRDRSSRPSGETALRLKGAGPGIEFPLCPIPNDRQLLALFDNGGWKEWPPHDGAASDLTSSS